MRLAIVKDKRTGNRVLNSKRNANQRADPFGTIRVDSERDESMFLDVFDYDWPAATQRVFDTGSGRIVLRRQALADDHCPPFALATPDGISICFDKAAGYFQDVSKNMLGFR